MAGGGLSREACSVFPLVLQYKFQEYETWVTETLDLYRSNKLLMKHQHTNEVFTV